MTHLVTTSKLRLNYPFRNHPAGGNFQQYIIIRQSRPATVENVNMLISASLKKNTNVGYLY